MRSLLKRGIGLTGAVAMGAAGLTMASTEMAEARTVCEGVHCVYTNTWESKKDTGGDDGEIVIFEKGKSRYDYDYKIKFTAYGETLAVHDHRHDDNYSAWVDVDVRDPQNYQRDHDTFADPRDDTHPLGTPDGSGDVPETYNVIITLRAQGYVGTIGVEA